MQELKVRVWDEECRSMLTDDDVNIRIESGRISAYEDVLEEWGMEQRKIKNPVFMLYTGLKDRNEKEIYDKDIIHGKLGKSGLVKNYEIRWMRGWGWFAAVEHTYFNGNKEKEHYYSPGLIDGEVIGNILQNPELLEEQHGKTD